MRTNSKAQPSGWWVPATIAVGIVIIALGALAVVTLVDSDELPAGDVLLGGYISEDKARALPRPPDLRPFPGFDIGTEWAVNEPDLSGTVTLIHLMHDDSDCDDSAAYLNAVQNLYGDAGLETVLVIDESAQDPDCDVEATAVPSDRTGSSADPVLDTWLLVDRSGRLRFEAAGFPADTDLTRATATTLAQQ